MKTKSQATMNQSPSPDYQAASEKCRAATNVFRQVEAAYRARTIGDEEYLAARAGHAREMAEYDLAFAAEASRSESNQ